MPYLPLTVRSEACRHLLRDPYLLNQVLTGMWNRVPPAVAQHVPEWRVGLPVPPRPLPVALDEAARRVLHCCGWPRRTAAGAADSPLLVLSPAVRVRDVMSVLGQPVADNRTLRQRAYVSCALAASESAEPVPVPGPAAPAAGLPDVLGPGMHAVPQAPAPPALPTVDEGHARLRSTLCAAWQLAWPNLHKGVFWRMTVNGVRGAGGHDICLSGPCACGAAGLLPHQCDSAQARRDVGAPAMRLHTFWECPVAQAVLLAVASALSAAGAPPRPLVVAHLWLCMAPWQAVDATVWRLVCMAALSAMEHGRRVMWAAHFDAQHLAAAAAAAAPALRQLTLYEAFGIDPPDLALEAAALPPTPVQRASRAAVADFWSRLQSFVQHNAAKDDVLPRLSAAHPFVARQEGRLVLQLPPDRAG
ncbi:MAG: hypothetical protein ACK5NY_04600 [Burkholderiaceae bacterium]